MATGDLSFDVTIEDTTGLPVNRPGADGSLWIEVSTDVELHLSGTAPLRVLSELPPTRVTLEAETPAGQVVRWASDSRLPENTASGLRWSSTAPGGFESLDVTLPRNPRQDYPDLVRLTTVRVRGRSGEIAGEYRLEGVPSVSGDRMAISPSAVGWQAHLSDDESHTVVFIDRDLSHWGSSPALRQSEVRAAFYNPMDAQVASGVPSKLVLAHNELTQSQGGGGGQRDSAHPVALCEAYYDAGAGNRIAQIRTDRAMLNIVSGDAWAWGLALSSTPGDVVGQSIDVAHSFSLDLKPTGSKTLSRPNASDNWRWAYTTLYYSAAYEGQGQWYGALENLRVIGDHGKPIVGDTAQLEGVLASDAVQYVIDTFCPLLEADASTIERSTFVIPHLVFQTPTKPADMVTQIVRFGVPLPDWYVWEGRRFYLQSRGTRNRRWRARTGPAQLTEAGPQIDKLWNAIIVQYQDVGGTTRTVGPPGTGCDTETSLLLDHDPDNPINQFNEQYHLPFTRLTTVSMGIVSTSDAAVAIGRAFLAEAAQVSRAGDAKLTGHVTDENGTVCPYWMIRAGDEIAFADAADTSFRRIVRVEHDDATRTASVSLDAPPESLQGILERLGVQLVGLGVS